MELHKIPLDEIHIPENRQRRTFEAESLMKLTDSIRENSLLHPIVVRHKDDKWFLVAGERRLRAIQTLWQLGDILVCATVQFDEGIIPCVNLGELDPLMAEEAELEENINREDLSWQERAEATTRLSRLRTAQMEKNNQKPPTIADLSEELTGERAGGHHTRIKKELVVAKYLDDEEVLAAKTVDEAFKVVKRKEATKKNAELAVLVGGNFSRSLHKVLHGDCIELLRTSIPSEQYDVILTDPPYGINADEFNDSGGAGGATGGHAYKDDFQTWWNLMEEFCPQSFRVAKPQAHLYCFCDVDNFVTLRILMQKAGWKPFRTPIIWHKPSGSRAPWPQMGPQRKYEMVLFAVKGDRKANFLGPDLIAHNPDAQLGHHAQKPVALYKDLLKRSVRPGDEVADFFCGSGPIFPAAHELLCKATGIERDPSAYGIAVGRVKELT